MDSFLLPLVVGIVAVVVGLILEYRTKWFARALDSARGKQDSAGKAVNLTIQAPGINSSASIQGVTINQVEGNLVINQPRLVAEVVSAGVPAEGEYRTHPTLDEIGREIEKLPLFQRESAEQCYIGLKVDWAVRFLNIYRTAEENICEVFAQDELDVDVSALVKFNVDISKYPEFKTLKKGHKLRVWGEISKVGDMAGLIFTLSNLTVKAK